MEKIIIRWANGVIQTREIVNCTADKKKQTYFTMNSPIYEAIENGTFEIDLGFGKHKFTINSQPPRA